MKKKNKLAFRGGSYSLLVSVIVLAIVIVVNICASALPTPLTKYDISSSKLYSITSNTKAVVNNLQQDVTIYWVCQADKEDDVIENLLGKYDSLSSHIEVVKKNPDVYPAFTSQYTDASVSNNSLIVESGDRFRYIAYSDIYVATEDVYSYSYTTSFDGEGAITSAINYVVTDDLPIIYTLEGHGEQELPTTFADAVQKANYEVASLSLLNVDAIPEDASCIMIYGPQSDISEVEEQLLADYVKNGGKLMVMAGLTETGVLPTLNLLLKDYIIFAEEGITIENSRSHYFQSPVLLLPDMNESEITDPLIESEYQPIIPLAYPLSVGGTSDANTTQLLVTSEEAFCKADGLKITTFEQEEDDRSGPFALAVDIDVKTGGEIVWFSSADYLQDVYNAYSSGANCDITMNALAKLVGEQDNISIRSKSLNYNYLTISESQGSFLKIMMIGVIPLVYLFYGIYVVIDIRRKQNEARK